MEPSDCKAELEKLFPDRYSAFTVEYNHHVRIDLDGVTQRYWNTEYHVFGRLPKRDVIGIGETLQEAFDKMKATL